MRNFNDVINKSTFGWNDLNEVQQIQVPTGTIGRLVCFTNIHIQGNDFVSVYNGAENASLTNLYVARTSPQILLNIGYVAYIKIDKDTIVENDGAEDANSRIYILNKDMDVYALILFADPILYTKYRATSTEFDGETGTLKSVTMTCLFPENVDINRFTNMNLECVYQVIGINESELLNKLTRVCYDPYDIQAVIAVDILLAINPALQSVLISIHEIKDIDFTGVLNLLIINSDFLTYEIIGINDFISGLISNKTVGNVLFTSVDKKELPSVAVKQMLEALLSVLPYDMSKYMNNLSRVVDLSVSLKEPVLNPLAKAFTKVFESSISTELQLLNGETTKLINTLITTDDKILEVESKIIEREIEIVAKLIESNKTVICIKDSDNTILVGKSHGDIFIEESMDYLISQIDSHYEVAVLLNYDAENLNIIIYNPNNIIEIEVILNEILAMESDYPHRGLCDKIITNRELWYARYSKSVTSIIDNSQVDDLEHYHIENEVITGEVIVD